MLLRSHEKFSTYFLKYFFQKYQVLIVSFLLYINPREKSLHCKKFILVITFFLSSRNAALTKRRPLYLANSVVLEGSLLPANMILLYLLPLELSDRDFQPQWERINMSPYFLGSFAKLRKVTICFVMSVRPSVRMEKLGFH
jgi:hypothetical protein